MRNVVRFLLAALLFQFESAAGQQPGRVASPSVLSSNAEQVAESAGLLPFYLQLKSLAAEKTPNPWQVLFVRQQLLERTVSASLQVDGTLARIDSEIAESREFSNVLMERRDHKENLLNVAGIATGGALGVVSSALQLSAKHAKAGNSVGIGAGVIVSIISVMSLRAQNGKRQEFQFRSNMLAELFGRPKDPTDVYSPAVLHFLDAVPAVDPDKLNRRQRLLRTWMDTGRLNNLHTPKDQEKIAHLTGTNEHDYPLSITELQDRRAMLEDLRAKLSLMKRDLADFLMSLPEVLASAPPSNP